MAELFDEILRRRVFAVTGVSRNPAKFGHIIYHFLKRAGYEVYPVNPNADCLADELCYDSLADLPKKPDCVVTVTQPWITAKTAKEVVELGIPYLWMQPGSQSRDGVKAAQEAGVKVVSDGACIMVEQRRLQP